MFRLECFKNVFYINTQRNRRTETGKKSFQLFMFRYYFVPVPKLVQTYCNSIFLVLNHLMIEKLDFI